MMQQNEIDTSFVRFLIFVALAFLVGYALNTLLVYFEIGKLIRFIVIIISILIVARGCYEHKKHLHQMVLLLYDALSVLLLIGFTVILLGIVCAILYAIGQAIWVNI